MRIGTQSRRLFGTRNLIGFLVTVPWEHGREQLQSSCIKEGWSIRKLKAKIRQRLDPHPHPTPRTALVLGQGPPVGCRALSQAFIIYFLAWLLGSSSPGRRRRLPVYLS